MTIRRTTSAPRVTTTPSTQPLLRSGSRGPAVATLQKQLNAAGFNAGAADGIFGPKTLAAVKAFQRARGLAADGIVGPKTRAALGAARPAPRPSAPSPAPSRPAPSRPAPSRPAPSNGVSGVKPVNGGSAAQRIVDIARREAGTLESGNNAGAITKYTGGKTGWPYCAKFVSWAYRQAGKPLPGGDKWAVADIKATIKRLGQWTDKTKLQPGMAATFSKWSHVEIVASPVHQNGKLTGYMMVGGNTTIPGTGGRQGVAHKFRSLAELEGGGFPVKM
jgi:peptidoglycan hydrolase-like protein with peptidoglycan-binding domain